jgi:DNA repair exonuclease SbcCD ATPase subunit
MYYRVITNLSQTLGTFKHSETEWQGDQQYYPSREAALAAWTNEAIKKAVTIQQLRNIDQLNGDLENLIKKLNENEKTEEEDMKVKMYNKKIEDAERELTKYMMKGETPEEYEKDLEKLTERIEKLLEKCND